jgi:hypothetical protein
MSINENRDMNRDPISGTPGSHPVGTGVGGVGGALAGAAIGSPFGPIGMLVGGTLGAIGGGAAGHAVAERVDPTGETDYWRNNYSSRPYHSAEYDFDTDYQPAYAYGSDARARYGNRSWDDSIESDLKQGWENAKAKSRLTWEQAKDAVRDAWNRDDYTYRTYDAADRYYGDRFTVGAGDVSYDFENDYRPAYRYGTYARSQYGNRDWDDTLESDLERGWEKAKGTSRMAWKDARSAVRDAWHGAEHVMPGDFDRDGR